MKKTDGLIAYYGLDDWWFSTFSDHERDYIDSRYQPMGAPPHTLTQVHIHSRNAPAPEFLNGLSTWFRSTQDTRIADRIHRKLAELAQGCPVTGPGYYGGRHFTTYVQDVENLKRSGRYSEAEELLLNLVAATEAEADAQQSAIAPWYYEQLAIIYRKEKAHAAEVEILERFAARVHGPGVSPPKLLARLEKARKLAMTR